MAKQQDVEPPWVVLETTVGPIRFREITSISKHAFAAEQVTVHGWMFCRLPGKYYMTISGFSCVSTEADIIAVATAASVPCPKEKPDLRHLRQVC